AVGVGGALQHRTDQPRVERLEELERTQGGLTTPMQFIVRIRLEQALVLAQRVLDLAIAWERGVIGDSQPLRRLELGLPVVAQAAFGHQSSGFVGNPVAAFAEPGFGVLCMSPGSAPCRPRAWPGG